MKSKSKRQPRALLGRAISADITNGKCEAGPGQQPTSRGQDRAATTASSNHEATKPESQPCEALAPPSSSKALVVPAKNQGPPKFDLETEDWKLTEVSDLKRTFGTEDTDSVLELSSQIFAMVPSATPLRSAAVNSAVAMIHDLAPKDGFERALAVQFCGAQRVAANCLAKAADPSQTNEQLDGHINRFAKLSRACCALGEALDRHRGKNLQAMVVGNVLVGNGGRAIVGPVNQAGPGKEIVEDDEQPNEKATCGQAKRLVEKR